MATLVLKDPKTGRKQYGLKFTSQEWVGVTNLLVQKGREDAAVVERYQDLKDRKALSAEMASTWPNTWENVQNQRFERRTKLLKEINEKKDKVQKDIDEEVKAQRQALIDNYDDNKFLNMDGSKTLHSAYRFAEMLRQRAIQIDTAKQNASMEMEKLKSYEESVILDAANFKKEEEDKEATRLEKAKKIKAEIWKMYTDNEERNAKETQERKELERQELEQMKEEIAQIKANEKKEANRKKQICRENVIDNKRMLEHYKKVKAEEELEEATANELVSQAKRKMAMIKKQKEQEQQAERTARRDRYIAIATAETADKDKGEQDRMKNAQAEKEEKFQKEEQKKLEQKKQIYDDRRKQQEDYLENLEKKKREDHEKLKWDIMQRYKKSELIQQFEEETKRNRHKKSSDSKDIWQKQMKEDRGKLETEKQIELNILTNSLKDYKGSDARFLAYADKLIEESKAKSRPTLPIELAIQKFKVMTGMLKKAPRPEPTVGWEGDDISSFTDKPEKSGYAFVDSKAEDLKPVKSFEYAPDGIKANGLQQ